MALAHRPETQKSGRTEFLTEGRKVYRCSGCRSGDRDQPTFGRRFQRHYSNLPSAYLSFLCYLMFKNRRESSQISRLVTPHQEFPRFPRPAPAAPRLVRRCRRWQPGFCDPGFAQEPFVLLILSLAPDVDEAAPLVSP
jgi:hypothetical protein